MKKVKSAGWPSKQEGKKSGGKRDVCTPKPKTTKK
jgi:hypothetical protein